MIKHLLLISALLSASMITGCSGSDSPEQPPQNTDTSTGAGTGTDTGAGEGNVVATNVFNNGAIYTVNTARPWAEAIAIKNNKIIFVGSNNNVSKFINDQTQVTDLDGKMMMPGFHDVHIHPIKSGSQNTQFSLDTDEQDAENFVDEIAQAAADNPDAHGLVVTATTSLP